MERNLATEEFIGKLEWDGKYWGPKGALKIGQDYFQALLDNSSDVKVMFFIQMSFASLFYSASGSAKGQLFKILKLKSWKFWKAPIWAWRSYKLLERAWSQIYFASEASLGSGRVKPSATDFDVMQSVARKWYWVRWLQRAPKDELDKLLELIQNSILNGLVSDDCSNISRCLLNIGYVDLISLKPGNPARKRINTIDTLASVWDSAQKVIRSSPDQDMKKQLARVYKHLAKMSKKLLPYAKELTPPEQSGCPTTIETFYSESKRLHQKYRTEGNSADQEIKASV